MPLPAPSSPLFLLCRRCDYSLDGLADTQPNCPECGTEIPRFPATPIFTCEAAATDPPRRGKPFRTYFVAGAIGLTILAVRTMNRRNDHPEALAVVGGIVLLVAVVIFIIARRADRIPRNMRVIIDLTARTFRFEHCTITANLGLPRSTGSGLELSFDQLHAANFRTTELGDRLLLHTARGQISLTDRLTNFHALCVVAAEVAPPKSPRSYSWILFILIVVPFTALLLGIGLYLTYR